MREQEAARFVYNSLIDLGLPVRDFLAAYDKVCGGTMADISGEFHLCTCSCHAIKVERIDWQELGGDSVDVVVTLWNHGNWLGKMSKLKQIWQVIRYGGPYTGEVCLTVDEAKKLGEELIEFGCDE